MRRHPRLQQVLAMLLRLWDAFELPPNPLDHLTELLGGPDKVRGDIALSRVSHVMEPSSRWDEQVLLWWAAVRAVPQSSPERSGSAQVYCFA